jgi:hypothetical protein
MYNRFIIKNLGNEQRPKVENFEKCVVQRDADVLLAQKKFNLTIAIRFHVRHPPAAFE